MSVATFDTLKFANTLKAAGVPDKQAEAQANAFAEVIQVNLKDLVTKIDLDRVEDNLRKEIKEAEFRSSAKIDTAVAQLRGEMVLLKWMIGVGLAMGTAIFIRAFFVRGVV